MLNKNNIIRDFLLKYVTQRFDSIDWTNWRQLSQMSGTEQESQEIKVKYKISRLP